MAENVENTNAPPAEEIDKETLISLLKDKGKEIKSLESKNKKLEERYVKVFRENKNLVKDKDTLEKLLLIIFDRDQDRFTKVESGTYDLTALTDLWNQRQDEKIRLFNETLEGHKFEKTELDKRVAELEKELDKIQNDTNPEADRIAEKYKTRISELENANKKLSNEIKELNDVIEDKNQELTRLSGIENEVDSIKAELLMKELQVKNIHEESSIKGKMLESERKNEVLRLRQEVESYQAKFKEFEAEKVARINNVRTQSVQTEFGQVSNLYASSEALDASPRKSVHNSNSSPQSIHRQDSEGYVSQFNENGQVNQEYLKNVIVKLFCYIEGDNLKEARILMNAISIIMKMNQEDREQIDEARRNNSLWSNTVHFLKDTFSNKGEVNYYSGEGQK